METEIIPNKLLLVPGRGLEPPWDYSRLLLRQVRLPFRHPGILLQYLLIKSHTSTKGKCVCHFATPAISQCGHEYFLAVARKFLDPGSRFCMLAKHHSASPTLEISRRGNFFNACAPRGNRTPDLLLKREQLYQLSY